MKIRDILAFGGLKDATVVAGFQGLDNEITSVSVLEVAEERISTWTLENQLFITSFYAIRNNVKMQKIVVETLSKNKVCGLVICHIKYILCEIDKCLLKLCDNLDFPLIIANTDTSYVDILNPIFQRLSSLEVKGLNYVGIREDFVNLLAGDYSVSDILKVVAYKIGYEISFFNIDWNCLYSNKNEIEKSFETEYFRRKPSVSPDQAYYHFVHFGQRPNLIYYIRKNHRLHGAICVKCKTDDTEEQLLKVADSLNILCTLLFSRSMHMNDVMCNYQQTFFSDLLVWNFPSSEIAVIRATELGYELQDKHHIAVVHFNAIQRVQDRRGRHSAIFNYINRWFFPSVKHIAKKYSPSNIVHLQHDRIIIFLHKPSRQKEIRTLCEGLLELSRSEEIGGISIGISRSFEKVLDIPNAYNQASEIASLGRDLLGEDQIATFPVLGMLFYLKILKEHQDTVQFCKEILSPLKQQDENKGTEYIKTTYVLLRNNLNIQHSAQILHVHRNTLLYRKKQIQELLGYDPFIMPYVLHFTMALLILYPGFNEDMI